MNRLRESLHRLRRQPAFTAVAILGLALGIGANVAIFSIVDGALLRPLSFPQPGRLIAINLSIPQFAAKYPYFPVNADSYFDWRAQARTLSGVALAKPESWVLAGTGMEPQEIHGVEITAGMFPMLGIAPALGRDFTADDDKPGRNHVVILTDAFWRNRFHADRNIIGRTIDLDGAPEQIVGVMPATLHFPDPAHLMGDFFGGVDRPTELFLPLGLSPAFDADNVVGNYNDLCLARMRPGVGVDQVRAELDVLNAGLIARAKLPSNVGNIRVLAVVQPLRRQLVGSHAAGLWMLLLAVGAILAMVCLNLAGLLLVAVQGRSQELAVRMALGSDPGRLLADTLREGMLLALGGGGLGVVAAFAALRWLIHLAPAGIPRLDEVGIHIAVLGFSLLLALACGAAFSAWPAWQAARTDPQAALRAGGRGATEAGHRLRLRAWLVGGQAALAAWLLILAGLLVGSYWRVLHVEKGFQTRHVTVAQLDWPGARPQRIAFYRDVLAKVAPLPGVTAAALVDTVPTEGASDNDLLSRIDDTRPMIERPLANFAGVSAGYVAAMGIPLLRGRDFTAAEILAPAAPLPKGATPAPVAALLSRSAAQSLWPNADPIGRQFVQSDPTGQRFTVVGEVADVLQLGLDLPAELSVYVPYTYSVPANGALVLRTAQSPSLLAPSLRRAVWAVRPDAAIPSIQSMDEVVNGSVASRRFQLALVLLFATTALILAALGIYGVVAYAVGRRRGEIGLRAVLGAGRGDLFWLVVRQGMAPVVSGIVIALAVAAACGRLMASLLFGTPAADPAVFALAAVALLATGLAACALPARRALGISPVEVL